ncbi:uncharacterized protein BDW43DRAFT_38626 [Aspergillus alliaceus]|uniref:uncharacterized protein n=1 Tax=Petromyces alliaceus TaxID=209559 RepID=UPI0012A684F1|nr:uncharacterized protein BDW43DRAFT_38626 [Aspergillus alliaceus]KAB8235080.1 hypothetical protein BDW43DRAFT_38626 [Aspergillus alliaceus]
MISPRSLFFSFFSWAVCYLITCLNRECHICPSLLLCLLFTPLLLVVCEIPSTAFTVDGNGYLNLVLCGLSSLYLSVSV